MNLHVSFCSINTKNPTFYFQEFLAKEGKNRSSVKKSKRNHYVISIELLTQLSLLPDYNCNKNNDDHHKNSNDNKQNGLIIATIAHDSCGEQKVLRN